jgi:hypothetical protein
MALVERSEYAGAVQYTPISLEEHRRVVREERHGGSIGDDLALLPQFIGLRYLGSKTASVLGSAKRVVSSAVSESREAPLKTGLPVALGLGTQAISRTVRLSAVIVPEAATRTYDATNNTFLAGLAGAAAFWSWNSLVGQSAAGMIAQSPKTLEITKKEFPNLVDFFMGATETKKEDAPKKSSGSKLATFGKRALAGVGLGPTMYVGSEMAASGDVKKATKVNLEVATGSSIVVGGLVMGLMEGIEELAERGHYELSQDIFNVLSNGQVWQGVGFGIAYLGWRASKKEEQNSVAELEQPLNG